MRCWLPSLPGMSNRLKSWWVSMTYAIRQAVSQVDGRRLKALCIAHQRETFVPLDEHDRPLMNGILWMDERARELLPSLEQALGQDKFHRLTGKRLSVNLTIAKIAWLKEHRPDVFAQTRKYLDVHGFLVHHLTGLYRTGWGCADPTGLFDMQNNCWAESLLDQVDIRLDQLPEVYPPGTIVGSLTPAAAEACGLPVGLAGGGGHWRWAGQWPGGQYYFSRRCIFVAGNIGDFGDIQ